MLFWSFFIITDYLGVETSLTTGSTDWGDKGDINYFFKIYRKSILFLLAEPESDPSSTDSLPFYLEIVLAPNLKAELRERLSPYESSNSEIYRSVSIF